MGTNVYQVLPLKLLMIKLLHMICAAAKVCVMLVRKHVWNKSLFPQNSPAPKAACCYCFAV